jgi:DNA-binding PucR family transcriptional regulator
MNLETITELYQLISRGTENTVSRHNSIELRKQVLNSLLSGNGFEKVAFDTRRINQTTEYNPRRGLQNYNRSEQFLTEATASKITNLSKLHKILEGIKNKYGADPEWQDSNARTLLNTLNSGLRTNIDDGDYTETQPGVGSLDYIEELLDMRYRLRLENIDKLADNKIHEIILSKDENLNKKHDPQLVEITNHDVATKSYDTLMEKLFGGVRASKENPNVERTVCITIKDKFVDEKKE